jgi:hypothetical protein
MRNGAWTPLSLDRSVTMVSTRFKTGARLGCFQFVRPFEQITRKHAVPRPIPLDLSHVTYDRRVPIQIDDLTRWYDFGHSFYIVAHCEFRKTYGGDVLFKFELLFTVIHSRPPQLANRLNAENLDFGSLHLVGRCAFGDVSVSRW